jgi:hypothetical protein
MLRTFMKSRFIFLLLALLVSLTMAKADTITLKSGSVIKGDILSDTAKGVLIEYYATSTIKDQKTFSHDEIAKVETLSDDEKAYLKIGSLTSPPTVLDTSFYTLLIDKSIPDFINQYPYSKHVVELRAALSILENERSHVHLGDRKIDGVWISASQIAVDPYEFGAKIKFTEMKTLAENNDVVAALRAYELLEKNYPGSSVTPDAIALALNQMDQLQDKLNVAKGNFEVLDKHRQSLIASMHADQAKELKDALNNEALTAKTMMKAATLNGTKFFPIFPNSKEALDALQTLINSEQVRLVTLQKFRMQEGIAASNLCARLVVGGNLKEAQEQLALSMKLWPANIQNIKLQQKVDALASAPKKPASSPSKP